MTFRYEWLEHLKNLYEFTPGVPSDIIAMVSNDESGMALLRIVEIIGEDKLDVLGSETLNFIVYTLNQMDIRSNI